MPQKLSTIQVQSEVQLQRLTPQQLLNVQLVEMPAVMLEERVRVELEENEALVEGTPSSDSTDIVEDIESYEESDLSDGMDDASSFTLEGLTRFDYSPDDIPAYIANANGGGVREQLPIGDTKSFIDDLEAQMGDFDLDEHQRELVSYLIGSLSDSGFIDQPFSALVDEMLFGQNIETNERELDDALHILQQFEPAGIGARDHRECFLIQLDRKLASANLSESKKDSLLLQRRIIAEEYDAFRHNNIDRMANHLSLDKSVIQYAVAEIAKLNYNPGSPLNESSDDRVQTVLPDFIIETDSDGNISFRLNKDNVPSFHVSKEYRELAMRYQTDGVRMKEREKQQLAYCKAKYDKAQMFVEAINTRHHTLTVAMKAMIDMQRQFVLTQDLSDLVPLVYKDVAERAHLDVSTVGRVVQSKFASIDGHIYALSTFFKHNRKNAQGEEVDADVVSQAIRALVESEDKDNPYVDTQLVEELARQGIKVARRTVASYREKLAIPVASKRRR